MEVNEPPNVLSKEQIDSILSQAWEAEETGHTLESVRLYRSALHEIALFRDHSPKSDLEVLNRMLYVFVHLLY